MSDPETKFSRSIGWTAGERTARYAMIIDHGKIVYAEKEPGKDVTVCFVLFCGKLCWIADADYGFIGVECGFGSGKSLAYEYD